MEQNKIFNGNRCGREAANYSELLTIGGIPLRFWGEFNEEGNVESNVRGTKLSLRQMARIVRLR